VQYLLTLRRFHPLTDRYQNIAWVIKWCRPLKFSEFCGAGWNDLVAENHITVRAALLD